MAIGGDAGDDPLDPRSDARLGTSALVALADELGADVAVADRLPDLDAGGPDVIVLLADLLDDEQRVVVDDWVDRGGRLVVTDPGSAYVPPRRASFETVADLGTPAPIAGRCEIDALAGIEVADVEPRNGGVLYPPVGVADRASRTASAPPTSSPRAGGRHRRRARRHGDARERRPGRGRERPGRRRPRGAPSRAPSCSCSSPGPWPARRRRAHAARPGPRRGQPGAPPARLAFVLYALGGPGAWAGPWPSPSPWRWPGPSWWRRSATCSTAPARPTTRPSVLRDDLRRFLADRLGLPAASTPDVLVAVAARPHRDRRSRACAGRSAPPPSPTTPGSSPWHAPSTASAGGPRPCLTPSRPAPTGSSPAAVAGPHRRPRAAAGPAPRPAAAGRRPAGRRPAAPGPAGRRRDPRTAVLAVRDEVAQGGRGPGRHAVGPGGRPAGPAATCCSRACPAWPRR